MQNQIKKIRKRLMATAMMAMVAVDIVFLLEEQL